jgi:hypothetical protein
MPANTSHIDLLLQYSLLVAGENDELAERELGPIHLVKYVYLGDLAHARRFHGQTFTGTGWRFHKFGPWAQEVYERVRPALLAVGANVRSLPSDYEGKEDWERWSLRDDGLLKQREQQVPASILLRLRPEIREFGKDTPGLLDYVYRTAPMLNAAPSEHLDFSTIAPRVLRDIPTRDSAAALQVDFLRTEPASHQKLLKQRINSLHKRFEQRAPRKLINPVKNARYDDVYHEGVAWLDGLAGQSLQPSENVVRGPGG